MKAEPAESLYVGDVYSVDYVGARNAGMEAVLFDVAGAYRERGAATSGVPERVGSLAASAVGLPRAGGSDDVGMLRLRLRFASRCAILAQHDRD